MFELEVGLGRFLMSDYLFESRDKGRGKVVGCFFSYDFGLAVYFFEV